MQSCTPTPTPVHPPPHSAYLPGIGGIAVRSAAAVAACRAMGFAAIYTDGSGITDHYQHRRTGSTGEACMLGGFGE